MDSQIASELTRASAAQAMLAHRRCMSLRTAVWAQQAREADEEADGGDGPIYQPPASDVPVPSSWRSSKPQSSSGSDGADSPDGDEQIGRAAAQSSRECDNPLEPRRWSLGQLLGLSMGLVACLLVTTVLLA